MSNPLSSAEPWSLVAAGYKKTTQQFLEPYSREAIALLRPRADDTVLDVATGPGTLCLPLAPHVRAIHAIDFSEAMIAELRQNLAASGITNVTPAVMDGQQLAFPGEHFDAAFSMFGLMFFPDKLQGMREMLRVLKPGRPAAISSWAPVSRSPLMQLMFGALRAADPTIPAPQATVGSLEDPGYFAEQLRLAGFVDIEIRPCTPPFEVTEADGFFDFMVEGSAPMQWMRRKVGEETWQERARIMRAYMMEQLQDLPRTLTSEALLATARRPD